MIFMDNSFVYDLGIHGHMYESTGLPLEDEG